MKYALKKAAALFFTLWIVSLLAFLAFDVIPGDAATSMLGTQATPEKVEALREEMGLNQPVAVRYLSWAGNFLQGDFGISLSYRMPVRDMIAEKIPITLWLTFLSFIIMTAIAIPFGIFTAKHAGSRTDKILYALNQVMMAVPPFFMGILLTYLFGLTLKWFTPGGFVSYDVNFVSFIGYLIFPAIAIALPKSAMAAKLLRSALIEQAQMDYTRTAYSKGNSIDGVLWKHLLKNAMIPVVTFLGMSLADIMAGSIIMEQVFGIPGIGRILLTSISNRDYPVVQAIIVAIAFAVILINFVVDLLYRRLDPRVKSVMESVG